MWSIAYGGVFFVAWLIARVVTGWLRQWALSRGVVDRPDKMRKQHAAATPLLGGVAIAVAFNVTVVLGLAFFFWLTRHGYGSKYLGLYRSGVIASIPQLCLIAGAGIGIMLVGLRDDFRPLNARQKLAGELLIAFALYAGGVRISLFVTQPLISAFLSIVWIIGITNAFNLLDNMDGLSCGTALISSLFFFAITAFSGQLFIATLLACFIGSLAGFLAYNVPPARMFMGDAGSLFIGLMLSILTVISTYYTPAQPTPAPVIIPLLIMAIPLFDTLSVITIRWRSGKGIFTADTNHLSHRLVRLGMTRGQAVAFICLLNCCVGLSASLLLILPAVGCAIVMVQSLAILTIPVFLEKIKQCSS